jgi:hypothetical protein
MQAQQEATIAAMQAKQDDQSKLLAQLMSMLMASGILDQGLSRSSSSALVPIDLNPPNGPPASPERVRKRPNTDSTPPHHHVPPKSQDMQLDDSDIDDGWPSLGSDEDESVQDLSQKLQAASDNVSDGNPTHQGSSPQES